ncbi:hypothetical protein EDF70_105105 [Neorhizobium sp. JUb45]|nr:hypothetical protein EDF70_105105 [Neorhizobium sp. JUb45]
MTQLEYLAPNRNCISGSPGSHLYLAEEVFCLFRGIFEEASNDIGTGERISIRVSKCSLYKIRSRASAHGRRKLYLALESCQRIVAKHLNNICDGASVSLGDLFGLPARGLNHFNDLDTGISEITCPLRQNALSSKLDGKIRPLMAISIPYLFRKKNNGRDCGCYSRPATKSRDPLSEAPPVIFSIAPDHDAAIRCTVNDPCDSKAECHPPRQPITKPVRLHSNNPRCPKPKLRDRAVDPQVQPMRIVA